jgi:hypothetical protein
VQKATKKQNKRRKRTQYMCREMLRWLRLDINFRPVDMYTSLGIPRRTYQDYEAGHRSIPPDVSGGAWDIHKRNRLLMDNMCRGAVLPSRISGYSPGEWLRKTQQAEFEAGIIRVPKGK